MDTELNAKSGATLAAPRLARARAKGTLAWLGALVLLIGLPAMGYAASQAHLQRLPRPSAHAVQLAQNVETPGEEPVAEEAEDSSPESSPAASEEPAEEQPAAVLSETAPEPFPGEPVGDKIILRADQVYYEGGATIGQGNVVVRGEDLTITADVVEIDANKEWAQFYGNVVMESENQVTTAEKLLINLDTEHWEIRQGRARIEPAFFEESQVLEPLFAGGKRVTGDAEAELIQAYGGMFTSCNKDHPHYGIRSKHIELRPNRKVVIEDPSFYVGSTRLFWLPFKVVASLAEKKNRFIPELGQNQVEGYYTKLAYMYLAGQAAEGLLRLNLTQKRGIGLGVDHSIFSDQQTGEGSLFFEPSQGAMTARLRHSYQFSSAFQSSFRGSYQQRSGYFGSTTSQSADLTFRYNDADTDSQIGFQRSLTRSSYSLSRRFTTNFNIKQNLSPQEWWRLQTNMRRRSRPSGEAADEELDARFEYRRQLGQFDYELLVDNRYDLDGSAYTGDNYFALNRLPQITFRTDTRRLNDWKLLGRVPIRSSVQLGRYSQDPEGLEVMRGAIDTQFGGSTRQLSDKTSLRTTARYLQAFYDEGSAQYIANWNANLRRDMGGGWQSQLRYGFQSRHGFAPIRIDYAGRRHDLYFQAVHIAPDRSRLDLSSGFDFIGDRWRDLLLRAEYMPSSQSRFDLQSGYSLEYSRWRPLSLRFHQVHLPRFYLTLGTEYDLEDSELRRATMEIDWQLHRKWRVELLTGYTGYRNKFDTLDIELTREFHCWIASLTYSKQLDEVRLNLGIKAFPSPERTLGIGRRGARFQNLPGQYF